MGSTIAPPQFSADSSLPVDAPQYMQALERANRVRLARAAFKRRLAGQPDRSSSCLLCADAVVNPPDVLASMTVIELLLACRRIGMVATRKILAGSHVHEMRKLEALTHAERQRLATALRMAA
jgi:hypothetical protein